MSLSVATVIEKNRLSSNTPFLVCLDITVVDPATGVVSEVLYFVKNTESITVNSVPYEPANFDIDVKSEAGAQPTITLTVRDYDRALQSRVQAYGGGVGFQVQLMVVNADRVDSPPEVVEFFEVMGVSGADYVLSFTLGAENPLAKVFPRRRQTKNYCSWKYKDPDTCGYSGGIATCDLSLQGVNGCAAHGNTPNFGGYFGINNKGRVYG